MFSKEYRDLQKLNIYGLLIFIKEMFHAKLQSLCFASPPSYPLVIIRVVRTKNFPEN